jgi:hypothetical protein
LAVAAQSGSEGLAWGVRQLTGPTEAPAPRTPPLTARTRQLLETARDLVTEQRKLTDDPLLVELARAKGGDGTDPLVAYHRSTVAMTEAALRLVQGMPETVEGQLRLCAGLEGVLLNVRDRLGLAGSALALRKVESERIDRLARLLARLERGEIVPLDRFTELAELLIQEARRALPLRFFAEEPTALVPATDREASCPAPARFVAASALTLAQVVARVAPHDFEWSRDPALAVTAALLCDVGMLRVPVEILNRSTPLSAFERRELERHASVGATILRRAMPEAQGLPEIVAAHHEMIDGTGYPAGAKSGDVPSMARLLAVCAEYAGRASERPHRPAADPRTALTDVLLAAESGRLDRDFAELLLHLSFHPVGTVVELSDGAVAVVVATPSGSPHLRASARPVVAILADGTGQLLPRPGFVDLGASERGSVVRSLSRTERRTLLADRYPELC